MIIIVMKIYSQDLGSVDEEFNTGSFIPLFWISVKPSEKYLCGFIMKSGRVGTPIESRSLTLST